MKFIENRLEKLKNTKLVCKYYTRLLGIIKEETKDLNSKTRYKANAKITDAIMRTKERENLLKVFKIIKDIIIENHEFFTSQDKEKFKSNVWNILYKVWKSLNKKENNRDITDEESKYLYSLNNLVNWEYRCWYRKTKFLIVYGYYKFLFLVVKYFPKILKYLSIMLMISMLSIYWYERYYNKYKASNSCVDVTPGKENISKTSAREPANNDIKTSYNNKYVSFKPSDYLKNMGLKTDEIKYLLNDDVIMKEAQIIKYENLSWVYIRYDKKLYNLEEYGKKKIMKIICTRIKKNNQCFNYIDNICGNKAYYIRVFKQYKNLRTAKILQWLVYIKLLLKLNHCL